MRMRFSKTLPSGQISLMDIVRSRSWDGMEQWDISICVANSRRKANDFCSRGGTPKVTGKGESLSFFGKALQEGVEILKRRASQKKKIIRITALPADLRRQSAYRRWLKGWATHPVSNYIRVFYTDIHPAP